MQKLKTSYKEFKGLLGDLKMAAYYAGCHHSNKEARKAHIKDAYNIEKSIIEIFKLIKNGDNKNG